MRPRILLFVLLTTISWNITGQEKNERNPELMVEKKASLYFPRQQGFVNDYEDLFTEEQEKNLSKFLKRYKKDQKKEIVIITLDSIPTSIEFDNYAVMLSQNWEVGKNTNGNAFTIEICDKLSRVRINTTNKTQQDIPNDYCKMVIDNVIIPEFRNQKFYNGLMAGLNKLIEKWR